jgi:phenylpropionate dioxygenase-like ring-hydroxylating dioxygenase large terminal subunit
MGPPDRQPAFPVYDSFVQPGYRLMPGPKYAYPCNWLQTMENAMDPAHTAFLHTIVSGSQFTEEFGVLPELEFVETPVGMILHCDAAGGTECLDADGRGCSAEPAASGSNLGGWPPGARV